MEDIKIKELEKTIQSLQNEIKNLKDYTEVFRLLLSSLLRSVNIMTITAMLRLNNELKSKIMEDVNKNQDLRLKEVEIIVKANKLLDDIISFKP